mgnify:FL=1
MDMFAPFSRLRRPSVIYQTDWQHRRSAARRQAVRHHFLQRPVRLKPLARLRHTLLNAFETLLFGHSSKRRLTLAGATAGLVVLAGMVVPTLSRRS